MQGLAAGIFPDISGESPGADAGDRPCYLTSRDYTLLQAHLVKFEDRMEEDFRDLRNLMRAKLRACRVVLSEDVPATVATGNSRLVFVRDGRRETRVLTHWEDQIAPDLGLPVTTALGLTLLGMSEGDSAPLPKADGGRGSVVLETVAYQPERAAREQLRVSGRK